MDLDAEIREYQWRRKFEAGRRRTLRLPAVAAIIVLILIAIVNAHLRS
ncbi:MAG TPA: hypothetical protein VEQ63_00860 [Bryobacteraceae bacterium]|nr:hypothetical protein [Bryobacteraceae bacterium]